MMSGLKKNTKVCFPSYLELLPRGCHTRSYSIKGLFTWRSGPWVGEVTRLSGVTRLFIQFLILF